jgi:hypothetical protein
LEGATVSSPVTEIQRRDEAAPSASPHVAKAVAVARSIRAACSALFAVGFIARIAPLFDHGGRLLAQYPTEDGYFMLTMARNLSLGHGLSVAGGATPTNGTQPLTTFVWGFAYALVGGDAVTGVSVVLGLEVAIAVLAAYGIYRLATKLFAHRADATALASVASAVWFASSTIVPHTMNCLETGLYIAIATFVALTFVEDFASTARAMSVRRAIAVGMLLGLAFWARNDAVFLILGACLAYVYGGLEAGRGVAMTRFARTLVFGTTSVLVALPWMIYNYVGFGHPMPVSGRAESVNAVFGGNVQHLPAVLFEVVALVVPVPHRFETLPIVIGACAFAVLAIVIGLALRFRSWPPLIRQFTVMVGIYALGLSCFYGLFFGAPWFMSRYLAPLSPFAAILWSVLAFEAVDRFAPSGRVILLPLSVAVALALALNGRTYLRGDRHAHFQCVDWVRENVPEESWVAAVQTGTLGYFHERTINLDGKVNPDAYEAIVEDRLDEYVLESPAEFVVDWAGIADWARKPKIAAEFELVVHDPERGLGVLRRRGVATAP